MSHSLGNDQNALSVVIQAIKAAPDNARAYNNRSLFAAALGNGDQSLADTSEAIRPNGSFADAYANRGSSPRKLENYGAALADYVRATELAPQLPQGRNGDFLDTLAAAYAANGQFSDAVQT